MPSDRIGLGPAAPCGPCRVRHGMRRLFGASISLDLQVASSKQQARLSAAAEAIRSAFGAYGTLLTVAREWTETLLAHSEQQEVEPLPPALLSKLGQDPFPAPQVRFLLSERGRELDTDLVQCLEGRFEVLRASIKHAIDLCQGIAGALGPTFSSPGDRQAEIILMLRSLIRDLPLPALIPAHAVGGVPRVLEEHAELLEHDRVSGVPERLMEAADWLDAASGSSGVSPRKRKRRGRPQKSDAKMDVKLVERWRASGQTRRDYELAEGLKAGEVQRATDRIKYRASTRRNSTNR